MTDQQEDRHAEQRPDEVVQVLGEDGEPREQRVADERQQHALAEEDDDAGDRENAEPDRDRPMHRTLDQRKAGNLATGGRRVRLDRPLPQIERGDHQQRHGDKRPTADNGEICPSRSARHVCPCGWISTFVSRPTTLVYCFSPERISFHTGALLSGCVTWRAACCLAWSASCGDTAGDCAAARRTTANRQRDQRPDAPP